MGRVENLIKKKSFLLVASIFMIVCSDTVFANQFDPARYEQPTPAVLDVFGFVLNSGGVAAFAGGENYKRRTIGSQDRYFVNVNRAKVTRRNSDCMNFYYPISSGTIAFLSRYSGSSIYFIDVAQVLEGKFSSKDLVDAVNRKFGSNISRIDHTGYDTVVIGRYKHGNEYFSVAVYGSGFLNETTIHKCETFKDTHPVNTSLVYRIIDETQEVSEFISKKIKEEERRRELENSRNRARNLQL